MAKRYPVFIDVDKTLLGINSGSAMVLSSTREGLLGYHNLLEALLLSYLHKARIIRAEKIINRLAGWFKGKEETVVSEFARSLYNNKLKQTIRPGAFPVLEQHRANQASLVILSASTPYTCTPLMEELDMDHCLCSEMKVEQGVFTGEPHTTYCYGKEKLVRAKQWCDEQGFSLDTAWYYGDSWSDLPILEAVGNPVCVNPDRRLSREARKRNWKVVRW